MAVKRVLTVSQLNEYVRGIFRLDPLLQSVEVRGEISNFKFHQSGTLFFTLKDETAAISCVMYAQDAENLQVMPFEGMRAVVGGTVGLYPRAGQYQLTARTLDAAGTGVLYERLQALRRRLEREGLFDGEKKQPLPRFVRTVGVVSSPTGAVIHDILHVSLRRDPGIRVLLCPVRVQGAGAQEEVSRAIALLDGMKDVDVILVARGGGSMEDLWTFNEEKVVRAVAACKTPIVSAVGHETDVTLCDLAADLRAPTPSAAAECAVPMRQAWLEHIAALEKTLADSAREKIRACRAERALSVARLEASRPDRRIEENRQRLMQTTQQLRSGVRGMLTRKAERLRQKRREMELLSPYHVLARGYAIVQRGGCVATSAAALRVGEEITVRFADGYVGARVTAQPVSDMGEDNGGKEERLHI